MRKWSSRRPASAAGGPIRVGVHRGVVSQLAPGVIENVADGHVDIFRRVAIDDDLRAAHRQIDADVERLALVRVLLNQADSYPAAHDASEELVELVGLFAEGGFDRIRMWHVAEDDLQGQWHGSILLGCRGDTTFQQSDCERRSAHSSGPTPSIRNRPGVPTPPSMSRVAGRNRRATSAWVTKCWLMRPTASPAGRLRMSSRRRGALHPAAFPAEPPRRRCVNRSTARPLERRTCCACC